MKPVQRQAWHSPHHPSPPVFNPKQSISQQSKHFQCAHSHPKTKRDRLPWEAPLRLQSSGLPTSWERPRVPCTTPAFQRPPPVPAGPATPGVPMRIIELGPSQRSARGACAPTGEASTCTGPSSGPRFQSHRLSGCTQAARGQLRPQSPVKLSLLA
jgi:hypothetical protein